ncbi:hypothetical protein JQC67_14910 [Aurantibacter crassamenti]|uniref:hypothetical protein n=1 Tax=Aurantibacter crassamenti TaxID=1837375 RepID=UPI001939A5D1|nr:hypothetical protein [Aurantibacter crassamenti]MBM1107443.1 hypothetical protein [Aurantibacter crassamenti]
MKTYNLLYLLLACVIFSCSKSDSGSNSDPDKKEENTGADASYNLLVKDEGLLSSTLINATAETTILNPAKSTFEDMPVPNIIYNDGSVLTAYHQVTDCSGTISQFDFSTNTLTELEVFTEMSDCELNVSAIAHSDAKFYLTYESDDSNEYFVRVIDSNGAESNFIDVPLRDDVFDPTYVPKELVFANNRLFILGHDEDATDEYHIITMDGTNNTLIHDLNLGFKVKQIFKNPDDNIIVSYSNLHSLLNSSSMVVKYTNYGEGTQPNFTNSKYNYFDKEGRMYYETPPGAISTYATIPAVYDFDEQLAILYAYENFLTEAQYSFEFEIENTSMVAYDDKNDYIIIGYKKKGSVNKGGLLRIKPAPDPALIDNLNVEGIPYKLFVK